MKQYPEELITAFMCTAKRGEIMEKTGISKSRFYRLRKDEEFQRIVSERRSDLVRDAVLRMEGYLSKDVEILQKVIEDPETSAQTRLNGIQLLMNQLGQWKMISEMTERLQAVERRCGALDDVLRGGW